MVQEAAMPTAITETLYRLNVPLQARHRKSAFLCGAFVHFWHCVTSKAATPRCVTVREMKEGAIRC